MAFFLHRGAAMWAVFTFVGIVGQLSGLEIISLIIGILVGVVTLISKAQDIFRKYVNRRIIDRIDGVVKNSNNLTAEETQAIKEILDETK